MEWNVYYHDINKQEIITINIFNHGGFNEEIQNHLLKCKDKSSFTEEVRRSLFYYFGSKSEYEIIISPWCGGGNTKDKKIDIYSQVMINFQRFIDYVWDKVWIIRGLKKSMLN